MRIGPISSNKGRRFILCLALVLSLAGNCCAFTSPSSRAVLRPFTASTGGAATKVQALAQYSGDALSLFGNMITPASIISGALVPLGFVVPLSLRNEEKGVEESRWKKNLRIMYSVVAVASLASELIAVVWASVASNQLIETTVAPAESVWALLKRDYELEWAATNAHFVGGMLGFIFLVGVRSFFYAQGGLLGRSLAGLSFSALMLMVAIVNRGVAAGSGDGLRFGTSVISLCTNYVRLLLRRALSAKTFGVLEIGACGMLLWSIQGIVRVARNKLKGNESETA